MGKTEKENILTKEEWKQLAEDWLAVLRKGVRDPDGCLDLIDEALEKGGLTPEDIGTTRSELHSYVPPT